MAERSRTGVPGLAIVFAIAGTALVVSGLKGGSIADTLRAMIRGQTPPSGESLLPPGVGPASPQELERAGAGGTVMGQAVAATALAHVGVPYRWGGHTPDGWDCSGFVTWVLTQHGIKLPSNTHTVAAQFYTWRGARTIGRGACAPGDLVCWPTHVGVASGPDTFVNAPGFGIKTREQSIYSGAVIRRPVAYEEE